MPIISGGSGSGGTPGDGTITNAMLATSPNNTVKANVSGGVASDTDLDIGLLPVGSRYRPALAIIPYIYSSGVLDNDPTTTKFKFDSLTLASITKLWIDPLNAGLIDQTFDIKLAQSGDKFVVMDPTMTTTYTTFTLSSAYTDKTGYFEYSGAASAGTLPTNNVSVVLVYVSKGTEKGILTASNIVRYESDGAGGFRFIDVAGSVFTGVPAVYALSSVPVSGVTNLPAANTFTHGTEVRIHQDCFVGAGSNSLGVIVRADAVNNVWVPAGPQVLFQKNFGLRASTTSTLTAAGKFDLGLGGDPVFPAGLFNVGSRVRFITRYVKVGATAPVLRTNLGTDLITRTNNSLAYAQTLAATTDLDVGPESLVTFIAATNSAISTNRLARGSNAAAATADMVTLLDIAAAMKATYEASTLSGDTVNLTAFSIIWEA